MLKLKIVFIAVLFALASAPGFCSDPFKDFAAYATPDALKPFARDLGGVIGSGVYTTGRSLGFSGFDISMRGALQFAPSAGNKVLNGSGVKAFWFPWIQGEIGMPYRIDGFIRGFSYQGLTVSGGGFRWGVTKLNDMPYQFQTMVVAVGHSIAHKEFSAIHFGGGVVCSYKLPAFILYAGAGFDRTVLSVSNASAASVAGAEVTVTEARFTLGAKFKLTQFAYLSAAANYLHGQPAVESALGIRF